jgi:two-component system, LuxR family, response regulator FixJ
MTPGISTIPFPSVRSNADHIPRVHIVEDDAAVSDSLVQLLGMRGYEAVVYASAELFLESANAQSAGCAILDIRLPGMSGLDLQVEMVKRGIKLPVIVVTGHGDTQSSRTAFRAGAVDFIEKPIDPDTLLDAVESSMTAGMRQRRDADEQSALAAKLERLTARENEVLDAIVEGKHSREIAAALGISPRTVEVYKSRLMEKMQVSRTSELLRIMIAYRVAMGKRPGPAAP